MRGPYRQRRIQSPPRYVNFKPAGVPSRLLNSVTLTVDEFEALRFADYLNFEHQEAAEKMKISRPTFTRLIEKARQKVAKVLIDGMELIVEGGNIDFVNNIYECKDCGDMNEKPIDDPLKNCPDCGSSNINDLAGKHLGRMGQSKG